jgi:uncharacterized protein (DUF927 family)
MSAAEILQQAISLRWSIIPVRADKRPFWSWKEFQEKLATAEQISNWRDSLQPPAWAVITGPLSGILVLDFDGPRGKETMQRLRIRPHVKTGSGGHHAYFRHPGHPVRTLNSKSKLALGERFPGLDIRADGGYAIFAGRNRTGPYEWLRAPEPDELLTLPAEVRSVLGLDAPCEAPPSPSGDRHAPRRATDAEALIRRALECAPDGGRNNMGFWLACQLRDREATEAEAIQALRTYAASVAPTNTKGQHEPYTEADAIKSLRKAFDAPRREPPRAPRAHQPKLGMSSASRKSPQEPHPAPAGDAEPRRFDLRPDGLYVIGTENHRDRRIAPRIEVVAHARNSQGMQAAKYVRFLNWEGEEKHVFIPLHDFYGDRAASFLEPLTDAGFVPKRDTASLNALRDYLLFENPSTWMRSTPTTGWHGPRFVLPDESIGPDDAELVVFRSEAAGDHRFAVSGTAEDWLEHIGKKCSGNSRLVFSVCCALAAPTLDIVQAEGAGFHIRGISSTGKTTALDVAGSVCGGNPQHGYKQTWRATKNGLEARAAEHNHLLLCLDEIGEVDDKEAGEIVYALANGLGKSRMSKSLTLRPTTQHKLILLSTGERTLPEVMKAGRKTVKGGQEARLVEIEADAGAEMGLFENLHGAENPNAFAQQLRQATRRYYGAALRAWLKWLTENRDIAAEQLASLRSSFVRKNAIEGSSGEVQRVLNSIALVGAAGELASPGITGWKEGEALEAARRIFQAWITVRGGTGSRDVDAGISALRTFLLSQASRFQDRDDRSPLMIRDRAGYTTADSEGRCYYIFTNVFSEEVCRDLDASKIAKELNRRGFLTHDEGRLTRKMRAADGSNVRYYAIKPCFLGGEIEGE